MDIGDSREANGEHGVNGRIGQPDRAPRRSWPTLRGRIRAARERMGLDGGLLAAGSPADPGWTGRP